MKKVINTRIIRYGKCYMLCKLCSDSLAVTDEIFLQNLPRMNLLFNFFRFFKNSFLVLSYIYRINFQWPANSFSCQTETQFSLKINHKCITCLFDTHKLHNKDLVVKLMGIAVGYETTINI